MPTVRTYGQRQVTRTALPGVRRTASETALALGAGVEQAKAQKWGQIATFGEQVARTGMVVTSELMAWQKEEKDKADDLQRLAYDNAYAKWNNEKVYGADGVLAQQGANSFGLPETVEAEFQTFVGGLEAGVTGEKNQLAFAKWKAQRGQELALTVHRHVAGERTQYEAGELKASVDNGVNAAIAQALDPRLAAASVQRTVDAIALHGPRLGLGAEAVEAQVAGVRSAVIVGSIERLLALDNVAGAKAYFDEGKGQIQGEALARVEKALEEGTLRGAAQTQSDAIVQAGGTFAEQREKARAIEDPKIRDAVTDRIEHEHDVKVRVDREQGETRLTDAFHVLDRLGPNADVTKIAPAVWAQLDGGEMAALQNFAAARRKGEPITTDYTVWAARMNEAGTNPEAFAKRNLLKDRADLDDGNYEGLVHLQLQIRNAATSAGAAAAAKAAAVVVDGYRTNQQIINDSLELYGINGNAKPGTPDAKAAAQLQLLLDTRVQEHMASTGKKPTNQDVQDMVDGLLAAKDTTPGSWWALVSPFKYDLATREHRLIDTQIGDIPAADRAQIEAALKGAGRPISDATVLRLYLEHRARTVGGK